MATLTQAWTAASAALPLGWQLTGLVLGGRDGLAVDEETGELAWVAMAAPRVGVLDVAEITGQGRFPHQALHDLAAQLRPLRGDVSG